MRRISCWAVPGRHSLGTDLREGSHRLDWLRCEAEARRASAVKVVQARSQLLANHCHSDCHPSYRNLTDVYKVQAAECLIVPGTSSAENFLARKHLLVKEVSVPFPSGHLSCHSIACWDIVTVTQNRAVLFVLVSCMTCQQELMDIQGFSAGLQDTWILFGILRIPLSPLRPWKKQVNSRSVW